MPTPLAIQLYTLREEAERDLGAVLERVAGIGYVAVETADVGRGNGPLHGMTPAEFRRRVDDLGLQVASGFAPMPLRPESLEQIQAVGSDVIVSGFGPESFASRAAIERAAADFNAAAATARASGATLGYHNHWWEWEALDDGTIPMQAFLERLDPTVFLELDVYWLQTAGHDPAATLASLGDRVRRLHVKDGPCVTTEPQTAVGDGKLDVAAVVAAAPQVEWHIAELDDYAGDMFEAVETSYAYLTRHGLSRGRI